MVPGLLDISWNAAILFWAMGGKGNREGNFRMIKL